MQPFKTVGKWWLPESPERQVLGTLSCTESGELELSLLGVLVPSRPSQHEDIPTILGVIDHDRSLEPQVTLLDCFVTSVSGGAFFPPVLLEGKQIIYAHRGHFGAHPTGSAELAFSRADIHLSGLARWARAFTGLQNTQSGSGFDISWKLPELVGGEVPGGTITLGVNCTSSGERERRLSEELCLVLGLDPPLSARQIEADYVFPLQNLLTFATDHANSVIKLRFTPQGTFKPVTVIGPNTFWDESVAGNLYDWSMLFTFEDVRERLPELCRGWFELSKLHQAAFSVYFGSLYRPPGYTDVRVSVLAQVVSLYTAVRSGNQLRHTARSGDYPPAIQELLASHPVITTERSIETLTAEFEPHFCPLLDGKDGQKEKFIEYTTNTIRYTLTRTPPAGPYASDGSALYWLGERLALLFKMAVIADLGFTHQDIGRLMERNRTYQHIRDTIRSKREL